MNYNKAREYILSLEIETAKEFQGVVNTLIFHRDKFSRDPEVLMHLVSSQYVRAAVYAVHMADRKLLPYLVGVAHPLARSSLTRRMS